MLLDEVMPAWHFGSSHGVVVDASPRRTVDAFESLRLDRDASPLVRLLFRARGLPVPGGPTPRDSLDRFGFTVLAEQPGREIVFGVAGKFWAPREMANLIRVPDATAFGEFDRPGHAKGAMNILVEASDEDGRTLLRTETRVWCSGLRARLLFGAYWTLIRVPSGWIRRDMLRAVARRAGLGEPVEVSR